MPAGSVDAEVEHVVLLDRLGTPIGTHPKQDVHGTDTPFHLGFSCYLRGADGRYLLTRRSLDKRTWPGVWSNSCCGHPQRGEELVEAVRRRIDEELGGCVTELRVVLPDFTYRAAMADGTIEHELCPVLVGELTGPIAPDPAEVDAHEWISWADLVERARHEPASLSPWAVEQIHQLAEVLPEDPARPERALVPPGRPDRDRPDPFDPVLDRLGHVLADHHRAKVAELSHVDPRLGEVVAEIGDLVAAGGKRLRPAFVYWGHRATGAGDDPAVLSAAAAVELLHGFALLHDDVMDRSELRRGRPAAHVAFRRSHEARTATGDARWFGISAAILAGDLAHVWADELLDRCPTAGPAARAVFRTLCSEVIAGQYLDLRLAGDREGEGWARRVALLKSARYTVTRPLLLGARLAGDDPSPVDDALHRYGDAIGLAFQMRDDVLGLFGDPDETGKGCLDDLRDGKRTVLVLRALRLATPAGRAALTAALGDPKLTESDAARCCDIVADSGALASVEAMIRGDHETALDALDDIPEPARSALDALAARCVDRRT